MNRCPARASEATFPSPTDLARSLRQRLTNAEHLFWYLLRNRRFLGLKFRRQHPVPPYVLDFYCEELCLAIELDGGQHNDDREIEHDRRRDAFLGQRGIRVLRYWNCDVLVRTEEVLTHLYQAVVDSTPSPRASRGPLPGGEGKSGAAHG